MSAFSCLAIGAYPRNVWARLCSVLNVPPGRPSISLHFFSSPSPFITIALSAFRLPGEAQKIARIMENFASQFCEGNPDVFANTDTAYVLSYSVIMLNTDAHNPQVKKKMTKEVSWEENICRKKAMERSIGDAVDAGIPTWRLSLLYNPSVCT